MEKVNGEAQTVDVSLSLEEMLYIRETLRKRLVMQFQATKLLAALNRTVDDMQAANARAAEADKLMRMIAALDAMTPQVR